jgi:hypothetical protein
VAPAGEAPPPPAATGRGSGGRRTALLVAIGLAIAAAVGLGAGGYALVSGGGHDNASGGTGTMEQTMEQTTGQMHTTTAMTTGMVMTETTPTGPPAQRLTAFVAGHPRWQCTAMPNAMGALSTKMCMVPQVPNKLAVSVYATKTALHDAYAHARSELGSPKTDTGACSATHWGGERMWSHGEGEMGGRAFCELKASPELSRLVWYSDLGTPTMYQADFGSLDHRQLFFWWVNFRHELF